MRRPLLVLLTFALASCALPTQPEEAAPEPTVAEGAAPAPESEPSPSDLVGGGDDLSAAREEVFVPQGIFPSLDALCAAQKELVRERVEQAAKEMAETLGEGSNVVPTCTVKPFDRTVRVKLGGAYLEARALEVETGYATETHVLVRTAEGWQAMPHASVTDAHNDPGCFSIERDTAIDAVTVEGSTVLILEGSDRGARIDDDGPDTSVESPVTWTELSTHAVACRPGPIPTCDPRVTVRVELVPSTTEGGRKTEVTYATSYGIDAYLHVATTRQIENAHVYHD